MFNKSLNVPKSSPFPGQDTTDPVKRPAVRLHKPEERSSSVVRIVHAGAKVKLYFMAIPAYRIMEKYPNHFVTRPEVFRWLWDAVVKPDEILALGRKYYVVPRRTVKKLRQRILKPSVVSRNDGNRTIKSYISRSSNDSEKETYIKSYVDSTDVSDTSGKFRVGRRMMSKKKQVWFKGMDENLRSRSPDTKKSYKDEEDCGKGHKPGTHGKRKTKLQALTWQPSLAAITETHE